MLAWLLGKATLAFQFFTKRHTPRQKFAGVAIGLWIGLVPKENLTAAALMTLMLATRASIPHGLLTSLIVATLAPFGDPVFDRVGHFMLANESLRAFWQNAFSLPLMHWTRLNNTVVLGSFVLGGLAATGGYGILRRFVKDGEENEDVEDDEETAPAALKERSVEPAKETAEPVEPTAAVDTPECVVEAGSTAEATHEEGVTVEGSAKSDSVPQSEEKVTLVDTMEEDIKARILAFAGTSEAKKRVVAEERQASPRPKQVPIEPKPPKLPPIRFETSIELAPEAPQLNLPDFDNVDVSLRKDAS